jgi:acyl dehydratase
MMRHLDHFQPRQRFASGPLLVEAPRIKSFATEFDPQDFHLDEDSARDSAHPLHQQPGVHNHG